MVVGDGCSIAQQQKKGFLLKERDETVAQERSVEIATPYRGNHNAFSANSKEIRKILLGGGNIIYQERIKTCVKKKAMAHFYSSRRIRQKRKEMKLAEASARHEEWVHLTA